MSHIMIFFHSQCICHTKGTNIGKLLWSKGHASFGFHKLLLFFSHTMSFCCSREPFRRPTTLHLVVMCHWYSLDCDSFWWPWQFWRALERYIFRISLILGLSDGFLKVGLGLWALGERWQRSRAILITPRQGASCWRDPSLVALISISWPWCCMPGFSTPFHRGLFGGQITNPSHS